MKILKGKPSFLAFSNNPRPLGVLHAPEMELSGCHTPRPHLPHLDPGLGVIHYPVLGPENTEALGGPCWQVGDNRLFSALFSRRLEQNSIKSIPAGAFTQYKKLKRM
jgi:hypothetical protein